MTFTRTAVPCYWRASTSILGIALLIALGTPVAAQLPPSLDGGWKSMLSQRDGKLYELEVTIKDGQVTFSYPDLKCSGVWEPVKGGAAAPTYQFVERVKQMGMPCADGSEITLTVAPNNARVTVDSKYTAGVDAVVGRGVLGLVAPAVKRQLSPMEAIFDSDPNTGQPLKAAPRIAHQLDADPRLAYTGRLTEARRTTEVIKAKDVALSSVRPFLTPPKADADTALALLLKSNAWGPATDAAVAALQVPLTGLPDQHPSRAFLGSESIAGLQKLAAGAAAMNEADRARANNLAVALALRGYVLTAAEVLKRAASPGSQVAGALAGNLNNLEPTPTMVRRNLEVTGGSAFWPGYALRSSTPESDLQASVDFEPPMVASQLAFGLAGTTEPYERVISVKGDLIRRNRQAALDEAWQTTLLQIGSFRPEDGYDKLLERIKTQETPDSIKARMAFDSSAIQLAQLTKGAREGEAFVDLYEVERVEIGKVSRLYRAFIVSGSGVISFDLGAIQPIHDALDSWFNDVDAQSATAPALAALSALAWKPIAVKLPPGITKVFLSGDSHLARAPWQALQVVDAPQRSIMIALVDGPLGVRDVRNLRPYTPSTNKAILVGNVDYGQAKAGARARWNPLPSSQAEVEGIAPILTKAGLEPMLLMGDKAERVEMTLALPARIVHLATHGVIQTVRNRPRSLSVGPWAVLDPAISREAPKTSPPANATRRKPLPRFSQASIVFAGANAGDPFQQRSEQYLTDLDLIALDFAQTDLMVLASCDTGRSEPLAYQGVGGMQLAVIVARARSLLMSLWPVNDAATPELMRELYINLLVKKLPKAEALRNMQVYAQSKKINPAIWAGWVLYGEGW